METFLPILSWWFAIQVISIVGLPFTVLIFRRFPLHGYALNKTLSTLLVGYSRRVRSQRTSFFTINQPLFPKQVRCPVRVA